VIAREPISPPRDDAELASLLRVIGPIFNFPPGLPEQYAQLVGAQNFRVLRDGGSVAGGLALLPMGQFYGGRRVAMTGVAVVGVAPDQRSRGVASQLMRAAVLEMREQGVPVSVLYPATLPLYRRVGYELAGSRFEIRISLRAIETRDREFEVRPIGSDVPPEVQQVHARRALHSSGHPDRNDMIWRRTTAPRGENAQGFLIVNPRTAQAEGYTYFVQKESPDAPYSLHASDVVALTPGAARRLLSFFADFRSMADQVVYFGSAADLLLKSMHDKGAKVRLFDHWMLRMIDVKAALEQRGYAPGVNAEIHLEIRDDLLPANHGRFVLEVSNGAGNVTSGGRGDIVIDVRGLASLYTGFACPHELLMSGQIEVAPHVKDADALLRAAAAPFAGPAPWMSEMF
jgi:predicted acetyltransferase